MCSFHTTVHSKGLSVKQDLDSLHPASTLQQTDPDNRHEFPFRGAQLDQRAHPVQGAAAKFT